MTEQLPEEFWLGVEQFNQREFYDCHDTLEALWMEAMEPEKRFYQGILQIAVALYHLSNQNWRGAVVLLGEGMNRLRQFQSDYGEVDVATFLEETAQLLGELQQAGPEGLKAILEQLGLSENTSRLPGAIALPTLLKL